MTEAQAKQFLAEVEGHRWYLIDLLAIACGMREGEILGLHVEDVSLEEKKIYIKRSIQYLAGQGMVDMEPKTDSGKRAVTLPKYAMETLRQPSNSLK